MQPAHWRAHGSPDTTSLISRLWNWGAAGRVDMGGPDGSCVNPIWNEWNPYGSGREAGWGDPDAAPSSEVIDEADAEVMDCWVRQLARPCRAILVQRFVLRKRLAWHEVDPCVRALGDLIEANWKVVDKMEGRT